MGNEKTNPAIGQKCQFETAAENRLEFVCSRSKLSELSATLRQHHPYETPAWEVYPLEPTPVEGFGVGRLITLTEPVKLTVLVPIIKKHLNLPHVRVALPSQKSMEDVEIRTIALCAGSGGEVVMKAKADLYWTGEMRHHDVLSAVANGTSVVLCEHSNTERGYLLNLKGELEKMFQQQIEVTISKIDSDPLVIV
jgi:putative NIF3 family GTP cyclohydrolase 1 type 2